MDVFSDDHATQIARLLDTPIVDDVDTIGLHGWLIDTLQRFEQLSGGEQALVSIAFAFHNGNDPARQGIIRELCTLDEGLYVRVLDVIGDWSDMLACRATGRLRAEAAS